MCTFHTSQQSQSVCHITTCALCNRVKWNNKKIEKLRSVSGLVISPRASKIIKRIVKRDWNSQWILYTITVYGISVRLFFSIYYYSFRRKNSAMQSSEFDLIIVSCFLISYLPTTTRIVMINFEFICTFYLYISVKFLIWHLLTKRTQLSTTRL